MGLYSFWMPGSPAPEPQNGVSRYFRAFWDNLGKLLAANLLTFAGFLPFALLASLGLVYENLWLALSGGLLGGAVAGPFWTGSLSLSLLCFRGTPERWFSFWRRALGRNWKASAALGGALGGLISGLLFAGRFFLALTREGSLPAPFVWTFLALDFLLIALAAALLFPPLCLEPRPFKERVAEALGLFQPVHAAVAALVLLGWGALGVSLFPVSVPFAAVLGFWPVSLLEAQLLEPSAAPSFPAPEADERRLTRGEKAEIFWRRRGFLTLGILIALSLALGFVRVLVSRREPDAQIAIVHAEALPDSVLSALEGSLRALVGDRNGDGAAIVTVNDYVLQFDGAPRNADLQAAGVTRLVADLAAGDSALLAVEDAEGFLSWYGGEVEKDAARRWAEFPVLAALDAGVYSTIDEIETNRTGQSLLAGYTVYRPLRAPEETARLFLK